MKYRVGLVGFPGVAVAEPQWRPVSLFGFLLQLRKSAVEEQDVPGCVNGFGGAKGYGVVDIFGGTCDPPSLGSVEGQFLPVHGKEILTEKHAHVLKEVAETTNNGIVFADGLLGLRHIHDVHHYHCGKPYQDQRGNHHRAELNHLH